MAKAATPEKIQQPQRIEALDVEKTVLDAQKKNFMEKPEKADKVAALNAYLKPLIAKKYIIAADSAGKYSLKEGPVSSDPKKQQEIANTLKLVNTQLAQMQDMHSGKIHIANKPNGLVDKYVLQDVFKDSLTDLLVDNALVASIQPKELSEITPDSLSERAKAGKLGALGALLNSTENVTGEDLKQRDSAVQYLVESMQQSGAAAAALQESIAEENKHWNESSKNVSEAIGNPGAKSMRGLRFMTGNLASKGPVAFVDSMPKIANLFTMLFAYMIPKGKLRNALLAGTGAQFLYGNATLNKSLFRDSMRNLHLQLGGNPNQGFESKIGDRAGIAATEQNGKTESASNTSTENPENKLQQAWLDKLNGTLPEGDADILREIFNTPVSSILSEVQLDRKNAESAVDQWDIRIKDVAKETSTLLTSEAKERLKAKDANFSAENVQEAIYRLFERIGTTWKREIITSNDIQHGNSFAAERTPAYLGWLVVSKVFSTQSQNDVNMLAKKFVAPNQAFGAASTLLLDRTPIRNTNDPYDNARSEIARIISGHETWSADAANKERTANEPGSTNPNQGQDKKGVSPSTKGNQDIPGATTAPAPAFERTPENINRALRMKELKERGTYSREEILAAIALKDKTGLFQGKIEQMMETQINNSVTLLAQGHIGQVETNIQKILLQFKGTKIDAKGTKMEEQKTLRTLYLRFYEDDRLKGHEPRIEELIRRLSPSLMHR